MNVSIVVDDKQVVRLFAAAPEAARKRQGQLVEGATIDVQRQMMMNVSVGATGASRRAIRYVINRSRFQGEVIPDFPHALPLEKGSRPHWTSVRPGSSLYQWARHKGISPYAVQRSIARKGTKAHPFVEPTYRMMKPRVESQIVRGMSDFARGMNNGSI